MRLGSADELTGASLNKSADECISGSGKKNRSPFAIYREKCFKLYIRKGIFNYHSCYIHNYAKMT